MDQNIINILMGAQIAISVLIVVFILLQSRAEGMGSLFGGGGEVFRTKRGLEKFLYRGTIVLAIAFGVLSLVIVKYTV